MVMAGEVIVNNCKMVKPSTLVNEDDEIRLIKALPFISRGGIKLDWALETFNLDVASFTAVDVGASTGGFTDCLLKRGVLRVYAVDVGYGQIDYALRKDQRVIVMERVNARYAFELPEKVDIATIDVSFISLEKVIPTIMRLVKQGGQIIALVKPQFEAGRENVGRGGLVKDPLVHAEVLGHVINWAIDNGLRLINLVRSPILGAEGNREFLVMWQK